MKEQIIKNAVKNLRAYGYPKANEKNIFTDPIYSAFFKQMLQDNKGKRIDTDKVINEIMAELESNTSNK